MLLHIEPKQLAILIAGRQYPFFPRALNTIKEEFEKLAQEYKNYFLYSYSSWTDEEILNFRSDAINDGILTVLNRPCRVVNGLITTMWELVKNPKSFLHYNDALCSHPHICWAEGLHYLTVPRTPI